MCSALNNYKMKNKELKTIWKLARIFWIGGTIIWLLETIFFLIYEGWHLKATNPIEIFFDKIVTDIWNFALWLTFVTCAYYLSNLTRKNYKHKV